MIVGYARRTFWDMALGALAWMARVPRWLYVDIPVAAWGWLWTRSWKRGTRVRVSLFPWFLAGLLVLLPNKFIGFVERGELEFIGPVRLAARIVYPLVQRERAALERTKTSLRTLARPDHGPGARTLPTMVKSWVTAAIELAAIALLVEVFMGGPLWILVVMWQRRRRHTHVVSGRKVKTLELSGHNAFRGKAQRRGDWFIGVSATGKGSVHVGTEARLLHTWIFGGTGTGKTLAVLLPQIAQDIQAGRPVVFIDGKADRETAAAVYEMARQAGREGDFRLFDLRRPAESCTYSPLLGGSANEQADKIMAALLWDNGYYRSQSKTVLIRVLRAMKFTGMAYTLDDVVAAMSDLTALRVLAAMVTDPIRRAEVNSVAARWKEYQVETAGMRAQLETLLMSDFGELMLAAQPTLSLADAYRSSQIVYFALPVALFPETAPQVAKLVIGDLNGVAGMVQNGELHKGFASIVVDEFAAFAMPLFIDLLNKARSAGMAITIAHQSMRSDLAKAGEGYAGQVADNTNLKICLRQSEDAEYFANLAGTRSIVKRTHQTQVTLLGVDPTGLGSAVDADEFQVSPNLIRELPPGVAIVKVDQPERILDMVAFDFMDLSAVPPFLPEPQERPTQFGLDLRRRALGEDDPPPARRRKRSLRSDFD
jgi:type IV secretory pathway TraG/TraD family ATPase VirD4